MLWSFPEAAQARAGMRALSSVDCSRSPWEYEVKGKTLGTIIYCSHGGVWPGVRVKHLLLACRPLVVKPRRACSEAINASLFLFGVRCAVCFEQIT